MNIGHQRQNHIHTAEYSDIYVMYDQVSEFLKRQDDNYTFEEHIWDVRRKMERILIEMEKI